MPKSFELTENYQFSNVYREGNHVANGLASYGRSLDSFVWLDDIPSLCFDNYRHDLLDQSMFRFN